MYGGQKSTPIPFGGVVQDSSTLLLLLDMVSRRTWNIPIWPELLDRKPQGPPASASPVLGLQSTQVCLWVLGIQDQAVWFIQQAPLPNQSSLRVASIRFEGGPCQEAM